MIKMEEKQKILLWNQEGKSKSEIALLLGLDVKTVRSYIKENEISLLNKKKSKEVSNFCIKPKYSHLLKNIHVNPRGYNPC